MMVFVVRRTTKTLSFPTFDPTIQMVDFIKKFIVDY